MPEETTRTGSCLCKAVTFSTASGTDIGACSCDMCRKWNGGPQMAVSCGESVTFTGNENLSVYRSSDWAERGFCKNCGGHLFYRFKGTNYMMLAGTFDDTTDFTLKMQYFIEQKPDFYKFSNETQDFTGEEISKMMGLG